jgi:hypothetical protein
VNATEQQVVDGNVSAMAASNGHRQISDGELDETV